MGHRLALQARADIDDIAHYIFVESGSLEIADRLIESIYSRFVLLGTYPRAGRQRDDLRPGIVSCGTTRLCAALRVRTPWPGSG